MKGGDYLFTLQVHDFATYSHVVANVSVCVKPYTCSVCFVSQMTMKAFS